MHHRYASINDLPIKESDRLYHWPQGRRPDDHPGLSDLGFQERRSEDREEPQHALCFASAW
jgi:hypothetical protein